MKIIKLLSSEVSLSSANNVASASLVRVVNPTASPVVATLASNAVAYANVTVLGVSEEFIVKSPTDTIQGTGLLGVHVAYRS
jgi:uncharacterized secreted protein with C-terminal beta-propeller domain